MCVLEYLGEWQTLRKSHLTGVVYVASGPRQEAF